MKKITLLETVVATLGPACADNPGIPTGALTLTQFSDYVVIEIRFASNEAATELVAERVVISNNSGASDAEVVSLVPRALAAGTTEWMKRFEERESRVSVQGRRVSEEKLRAVLETIRDDTEGKPNQAVVSRFGITQRTATNWIRAARELEEEEGANAG